MTTTPPDLRRVRALRDALRRSQSLGPFSIPVVVGLGSGFLASFMVDALLFERVETPWRQVVDALSFTFVAAAVWLVVQRRDIRNAIEVMTWLNGWEAERWQTEIGRRLPALPRTTPTILASLPDTMGLRPLRIELLAIHGRMDEARQRLEQLPTDTPWQSFERAALGEWISWLADGPALIGPMRAAAAEVEDDERSLVARAMVAAAEARRAAVARGDAIAPLAAIHPALGERVGRYAFRYGTGVIVNAALIGLIASVAVMVAAAIMR